MQFRPPPPPQVRARARSPTVFSSDRGCPLDTAGVRCLWHVGGTAGENDDAGTWRQQLQLGQWVRPVSVTTAWLARAAGARQAWDGSGELPTGPSMLASLSSGDGRNRRLSCASTLPICLSLLGGASTLAPYRRPWAQPGRRA